MRWTSILGTIAAGLLATSAALAQTAESTNPQPDPNQQKKGGQIYAGGMIGGLASFGGLNPNVRGGIELGYVFGAWNRLIAAGVAVDYAAPKQSETVDADARVPTASYKWHLTEQQLTFMPMAMARFTMLGRIVPFVGIGPRIYLLRSNVKATAGDQVIKETREQSTKFGFGVPLGVEFHLGPGGILAELLLEYGPLDHRATGTSNVGAGTLMLGYRFLLL